METAKRVFTVRPEAQGRGWLLCEAGDQQPQRFGTKDEAVTAGKRLAQGYGPARLQVLDSQAGVEFEQDYGKDPLVEQLEKFGF